MKKKALSVMLSLTVLTGCFTGFSVQKVMAEEPVEIQFLHTAWVPAQLEILEKAIADFEVENPGIKITETRSSWTDAPSQIMTSIVSGDAPDLIMCNTSMLAEYRGIGALADLTGYIPEELAADFLPSAKAIITTEEGTLDGLPQEGCNWALFYRKDLFEEAGLDPEKPPKTWDEFMECARALTKDTDGDGVIDQYGFGWPVQAENATDYWVNFMQMCGAELSSYEDGAWHSRLSDEAAIRGTQLMVDLVRTEKVSPESIVDYDWEGVTNAFVAGEVAMMHNGAWVTGSVAEKGPELDGKWGTAVLFAGPDQVAYRGYPNTFNILEASQHKDEAWKFLDYFYNTPSDIEGLTIAGAFCNAAGGMLYTNGFVDYAKANYDDKLQPFLDAVDGCKIPPMDPQWQSMSSMYGISTVQQMLMGSVSVEEGMNTLDSKLKELHGE